MGRACSRANEANETKDRPTLLFDSTLACLMNALLPKGGELLGAQVAVPDTVHYASVG